MGGAASSLMKNIFSDINTKILDTEMVILLPDVLIGDLDLMLRPIYGFSGLETIIGHEEYAEELRNNLLQLTSIKEVKPLKQKKRRKYKLKKLKENMLKVMLNYLK